MILPHVPAVLLVVEHLDRELLVVHGFGIGDDEIQRLVPYRIQILQLRRCPLLLPVKIRHHVRTRTPLPVFGKKLSCLHHFHEQFPHGGGRRRRLMIGRQRRRHRHGFIIPPREVKVDWRMFCCVLRRRDWIPFSPAHIPSYFQSFLLLLCYNSASFFRLNYVENATFRNRCESDP